MADVSSLPAAAASAVPGTLAALVVGGLSPIAGQIFLVLLGAVAGAFWALGKREKDAQPSTYAFMARLIVSSVVLTSAASWVLQKIGGLPYLDCLLVCSFLLAAFSDLWPRVVNGIIDWALKRSA